MRNRRMTATRHRTRRIGTRRRPRWLERGCRDDDFGEKRRGRASHRRRTSSWELEKGNIKLGPKFSFTLQSPVKLGQPVNRVVAYRSCYRIGIGKLGSSGMWTTAQLSSSNRDKEGGGCCGLLRAEQPTWHERRDR
jgi:hypothetical protein